MTETRWDEEEKIYSKMITVLSSGFDNLCPNTNLHFCNNNHVQELMSSYMSYMIIW